MNSKFNLDRDGVVLGFQGLNNKKWNYGGGFALSIIVFILSSLNIVLVNHLNKNTDFSVNVPNINPLTQNPKIVV
jgi:hypothetical protein